MAASVADATIGMPFATSCLIQGMTSDHAPLTATKKQGTAMSRDLPLNAIRVFSAVGRLLSLKKAADELGVTPSAVSHQISALEDFLGLRLLRRDGNHIALTVEGKNYLRQIAGSLTQLSLATKWVQATKGQTILRVSAPPSLASLWLMPRIARFTRAYPDIALAVVATPEVLVGRQMDRLDVAIRYGTEPPAGLHNEALAGNELFPVCSPLLLDGRHPLRGPEDLRHHTLLESSDELYHEESNPGWLGWLQAVNLSEIRSGRYLSFSPPQLMHQAMLESLGVGLMRGLLAADSIAEGMLVCPFGPALTLGTRYFVTCHPSVAERSDVVAFRRFVCQEADSTLATLPRPEAAPHSQPRVQTQPQSERPVAASASAGM